MGAAGDSSGASHSVQKLLLVVSRFLAGQLHLDVERLAVRDAMPPDIRLAVLTDVDDAAILGEELPYRVVTRYAAVFT